MEFAIGANLPPLPDAVKGGRGCTRKSADEVSLDQPVKAFRARWRSEGCSHSVPVLLIKSVDDPAIGANKQGRIFARLSEGDLVNGLAVMLTFVDIGHFGRGHSIF